MTKTCKKHSYSMIINNTGSTVLNLPFDKSSCPHCRIEQLEEDLSVNRECYYKVAEQRNKLMVELDRLKKGGVK